MPPVELNTVPRGEEASQKSFLDLKAVGKAMELPVVSDAVEKIKTFGENETVQSAVHMVEGGVNKVVSNQTVSSVTGAVLPHVTGALSTLDSYACDGLDSLTHAVPALTSPTPELVDKTKGYLDWAKEYAASFMASQVALQVTDKSLSYTEKAVGKIKPEKKDSGLACSTYARIRSLRRLVRTLKRAGARHNRAVRNHQPLTLADTGVMGKVANLLAVNSLLGWMGLKLVPSSGTEPMKQGISARDEELLEEVQANLQDLKGDLEGYVSDEDPDYEPSEVDFSSCSSSTSDDSDTDDDEIENEEEAATTTASGLSVPVVSSGGRHFSEAIVIDEIDTGVDVASSKN